MQTYAPEEKDRAQGALNFFVFAVMALSSFGSGLLVTTQGWALLNLGSLVPLAFTLAHADACRIRVAGHDLKPVRRIANLSYYELKAHAARPLEAICRS